ncbi:caveolae-associated protein 4a-like [Engraulis encrasicolus]|uniref:caveolae-associated protein 4a-like n=1 Tax=Engraulis encrasicolus TaxID=184585 RepID=UPI002FD2D717
MALGSESEVMSVLALLERVSGVLEGVQSSQARMQEQQVALEGQVSAMRDQVTQLGSEHAQTAATVQKLLAKSRRVSAHVKEVKTRVDKQNTRVRKVETSQDELLTRNRFRVVIFQGDTELPSVAVTKTPKGAGLAGVDTEPDEYDPPADLSSDDDYHTEEVESGTRGARLRAGLRARMLATRQRTRENLSKTGATLKQGGAALGGRVKVLGDKVMPEERRQRIRDGGTRLKQQVAQKVPKLRHAPRSVAEGEEEELEGGAHAAVTPPKGRRQQQEVTEVTRSGPVTEAGATSVPLDGPAAAAVETGKSEE